MGIATQTSDGLKFSTTYMYVKNSSGTTLATFKNDGNVGVGTNNPGYPLQVYYAGGAGIGLQVKSTANRSKLIVTDNDTSAYVIAEDSYASYGRNDSLTANNLNINSNGSVGIGTVSPSGTYTKLHVVGTTFIDATATTGGLTVKATSNANITLQAAQNTAYNAVLAAHYNWTTPMTLSGYGATVLAMNSGISKTLLYASNAEQIRITTTGVGIGLGGSDPTTKLTVSNSSGNVLTLLGQSASNVFNVGATGVTQISGATGNSVLVVSNSGSGAYMDIGSGALFVKKDGSVGIGTNSPTYLLDLESTATGLTHNLKLNKSSTTNDYAEIAFQLWSGAGTGLNTFGGSGTSRPSVVLRALNENGGSAAGAFVVGTFTGGSTNSTLTEKFRITSAGSVGIGTAGPVEKLDVAGKQRITHNIVSNATYQMLAFGSNRGINDYGGLNKDYWRIKVVTPGASTTGEGSAHGYGDLVFSGVTGSNTTYLNRFVIRSSGNIGIGTNVPSAKLHIQSNGSHDEGAEIVLRHSNNNSTDVVSTISFQNNGGQVAMMQAGTTGANNTGYISFFTDSTGTSGERMRIQGNGYVGIGTATAYSPLQVYSSADQKILLSGSANPYIRWQNGGSNRAYIQWIESGSIFGFFNSVGDNFDFFTHDSGGAINLRLKGSDGDIWGSFYAQEGTSPAHEVGILDADQNWAAKHVNDTSWEFKINNQSRLFINNSGSVGIGTDNPVFGLDNDKSSIRTTSSAAEKEFYISFANATANQKVDISFPYHNGSVFWGYLEVTITAGYSNQLSTGKITKVFSVGLNAPGGSSGSYTPTIYDNTNYYTSVYGSISSQWGIEGINFNSTTGQYYITIAHRVTTGNAIRVKVKGFGIQDYFSTSKFGGLSIGSVYTTDTTAFGAAVIEMTGIAGPLTIDGTDSQKIILNGATDPYIRFRSGSTNRAYMQWVQNNVALTFVNQAGDYFDFLTHDAGGAIGLRLKGNDNDIWGYVYGDENGGSHTIGFLDGDGAWALQHIKDTSWDFRINNSSKMTINSSGTVAIGGATLLTNEGMVLNRSGGAGYVAFYDGSGGAKWNIQRNAGVSNCLRIHAYNNTSQVFKVTKHYNDTDGFNILLDSGSVGMGTNSPNKTLEVRYVSTSTDVTAEGLGGGSAGKGLLIYNNNQSNNNVYANLDFRARNADGRIAYQYQTAANTGDFHFITDNTNSPKTQMIIKNDGKVGMGTVTPDARLHVYRPAGTVPGLLLDSNRDGARLNFNYSSNATTFGEIGMTHYGSSGDCQIWMGANLNSNSSSHSGPAVGVAGTGASSWYTVWNTQTAQDFYGIYRRAPSPSSSYENYFRIKSDGNVGINTTNPTDRLHIRSVQAAGYSGSNLATLSLETYNSNSSSYGSYVKCKNYGGGGGGPDWKIGGMEGYWTTNKVASIDFITGDDWYNPGNKDEGEIGFTVYNNTGSGSTAIEAMRIHQTGNIGIGSTNPGYKLTVNGSFAASSKSFVIDHPTKENKKLIHGSLEGPEHGVYHRGTTQSNTITLPDYWSGLVREDTITVQLTPRGGFQHLYVVSTSLSQIVIGAADGEAIDCFYTIYGERADIDSLVVEKDV